VYLISWRVGNGTLMRHFIVARPISTGARGMGHPPREAALVAGASG